MESLSSFNMFQYLDGNILWIVMVCHGFHDIGKSEKCRSTQPPFSLQCQVPMEEVPDQELEVTSSKLKPARTEATRPRFGSGMSPPEAFPTSATIQGEQHGIYMHTPICNQYRCQKTTTTDGRTRAFLKVKESSNPASLSLVK